MATQFKKELHVEYILGLDKKKHTFEYCATEHLRMSGKIFSSNKTWSDIARRLLGMHSHESLGKA